LTLFGERESGTARLEEAVAVYRAALEERTRARVPLQWASDSRAENTNHRHRRLLRPRHHSTPGPRDELPPSHFFDPLPWINEPYHSKWL
jgi:hypothetical protein